MSEPTALDMTDERLREIISGCDGVTPGPWAVDDPTIVYSAAKSGVIVYLAKTDGLDVDDADAPSNAAHIARLDPQTVYSMASELLALRQKVERLTLERDEARAYHEYFATESDGRWYTINALTARAVAAEASLRLATQRREDVVEALRPFAKLAGEIPDDRPDDDTVAVEMYETLDAETVRRIGAASPHARLCLSIDSINAGHFRRAALALQPKEN